MMMTSDPLAQLLRRADAAHPAPPAASTDVLTAGVRQRRRRAARRRKALALATAGVVAAASLVFVLAPPPRHANVAIQPPPAPPPDVASLNAELARLTAQADLHDRLARRLAADAVLAAPPRAPAGPVAVDSFETERTAALFVRRAQRLTAADPQDRPRATAILRQVVALFPQTRGAATARARLDRDPV
jgi:hypothetical protein